MLSDEELNKLKSQMTTNKLDLSNAKDKVIKGENVFSRIGSDLAKRGTQIKEAITRSLKGEQTGAESGLQTAGAIAGGVGDIVGNITMSALSKIIPSFIKKDAKEAAEGILQTKFGKDALNAFSGGIQKYEDWKKTNPRAAANFESVINVADLATDLFGIGAVKSVAKETVEEGTEQLLKKGVKKLGKEVGEEAVQEIGEKVAKETVEEVIEPKNKLLSNISEKLKEGAVNRYKSSFQATKQKMKQDVDKIAEGLMDENWWGSKKKLLQKADENIALTAKQYDELGELDGVVSTKEIRDSLTNRLNKLKAPTGEIPNINKTEATKINNALSDLDSYSSYSDLANKETMARAEDLRKLKQTIDEQTYGIGAEDKIAKKIDKKLADSIRNVLNTENPTYGQINQVYSEANRVKNILEETLLRQQSQNKLGLINTILGTTGVTAGLITGGLDNAILNGVVLGGLGKFFGSTTWKTGSALLQKKLADNIANLSKEGLTKFATQAVGQTLDKAINLSEELLTSGLRKEVFREVTAQ